MYRIRRVVITGLLVTVAACRPSIKGSQSESEVSTVFIEVGEDATRRLQEAFLTVEPDSIVQLAKGTFAIDRTLSLDVDRVVVRGEGLQETILSFKQQRQGTGGEALLISSSGVTISDLAVEDAAGDAMKINSAQGITVRRVRTEWTEGPQETNGAYGIYPVQCKNVLVEGCVAIGASDAGIYVGQSEDVIVRHNRVTSNVAGIEIENCIRADVYENSAYENTAGILVFSLPNLPVHIGRQCRVFDNRVWKNNLRNFAPSGNIVGMVPPGTGIMVMAYDQVEVTDNVIEENQTANLALVSYLITKKKYDDPHYDPYVESIFVRGNTFQGGGDRPVGKLGLLLSPLVGGKFPDIVYDGIVDEKKMVDGRLPADQELYIAENGDADFVNLDLGNLNPPWRWPKISRDMKPHRGSHRPLPPVILESAL